MNNNGNKIREQRKTLAYTIRELASLTNIPEKDIISYEANKKNATLRTLEKIAIATGTKVSDWVDEEYFTKSKLLEISTDEHSEIADENLAVYFYRAMFNADGVMGIIYDALLDMNEIELSEHKDVIFSDFSKNIIICIASIKQEKVLKVCGKIDTNGDLVKIKPRTTNVTREKPSLNKITYNNLLQEMSTIFKHTDTIEVIIKALLKMGSIDSNGWYSEKANLLLNTIMSNKVKSVMGKK